MNTVTTNIGTRKREIAKAERHSISGAHTIFFDQYDVDLSWSGSVVMCDGTSYETLMVYQKWFDFTWYSDGNPDLCYDGRINSHTYFSFFIPVELMMKINPALTYSDGVTWVELITEYKRDYENIYVLDPSLSYDSERDINSIEKCTIEHKINSYIKNMVTNDSNELDSIELCLSIYNQLVQSAGTPLKEFMHNALAMNVIRYDNQTCAFLLAYFGEEFDKMSVQNLVAKMITSPSSLSRDCVKQKYIDISKIYNESKCGLAKDTSYNDLGEALLYKVSNDLALHNAILKDPFLREIFRMREDEDYINAAQDLAEF